MIKAGFAVKVEVQNLQSHVCLHYEEMEFSGLELDTANIRKFGTYYIQKTKILIVE